MPVNLNPSNSDTRKFKVAAVQAEPAWLDLRGGVDKTINLIKDASNQGAKIVGFPEVFIPGFPWTPLANSFLEAQGVLAKYQANSMGLYSSEMDEIKAAAKAAGIWVVLGFSERDGGSLYMTQVTISDAGEIVNHRQKIKPTHYEKTIFGDGSARSIHNVVQTPYGRLGALNCWEHIQPLLKAHFYTQIPQLFVSSWCPAFPPGTGDSPFILSAAALGRMTQMVAMEGGCFGLAACQVVSEEGARIMKINGFPWFKFPGGGFSMIYGPDGSELTERIDPGVEKIVVAEISLDQIDKVKLVADTMGNYSRHDLLHVAAHSKNWRAVTYEDEGEQAEDDTSIADIKNIL